MSIRWDSTKTSMIFFFVTVIVAMYFSYITASRSSSSVTEKNKELPAPVIAFPEKVFLPEYVSSVHQEKPNFPMCRMSVTWNDFKIAEKIVLYGLSDESGARVSFNGTARRTGEQIVVYNNNHPSEYIIVKSILSDSASIKPEQDVAVSVSADLTLLKINLRNVLNNQHLGYIENANIQIAPKGNL